MLYSLLLLLPLPLLPLVHCCCSFFLLAQPPVCLSAAVMFSFFASARLGGALRLVELLYRFYVHAMYASIESVISDYKRLSSVLLRVIAEKDDKNKEPGTNPKRTRNFQTKSSVDLPETWLRLFK